MRSWTVLILTLTISLAGPARADQVFFQDDFGLDPPLNGWTVTNTGTGYTLANPGWAPDLDGNGLCRTISANASSTVTLIRPVDSPAGTAFVYPKLDGYTFCDPARNSRASWAISRDGVTWDFETFGSPSNRTVYIDTAGDPRYALVNRIWIKGYAYRGSYTAGIQNPRIHGSELAPFVLDYSKVGLYGSSASPPCDVAYFNPAGHLPDGYFPNMLNVDLVYAVKPTLEESLSVLGPILNQIDLPHVNVLVLGEENINGPVIDGLYHHIKANYPGAPPVYQWMVPMQYAPEVSIDADGYVMDSYGTDGPTFRKYLMKHLVTGKPVLNCIWASPAGGGFGGWDEMHTSSQGQVDVCGEFNIPMFFFAVDWSQGGGSVNCWLTSMDPAIGVWRDWFNQVRAEAHATDTSTLPAASANHSEGAELKIAGDARNSYRYEDNFTDEKFIDRATIEGFLNLRWDFAHDRLIAEPKPNVPNVTNQVSLIYAFYADTSIRDIGARIAGQIRGAGTQVDVALSTDGVNWVSLVSQSGSSGMTDAVDLTSGGAMVVGRFYVRFRGQVPTQGDAYVAFDDFTVTAQVDTPGSPEIHLAPDLTGQVLWEDDFESQGYLHTADIVGPAWNPASLCWQPEQYLYINGLTGYGNWATLRQKFVCDYYLKDITATIQNNAVSWTNWAAYNTIGISLDGSTILASDNTTNYPPNAQGMYTGAILATVPVPAGTREFYIHSAMYSGSGVAGTATNKIDDLKITAVVRDSASLEGTVDLGSYPPGPGGVPVTVGLRRQGGDIATYHPVLDACGRFFLPSVLPGTYDVWVKASGWLSQLKTGVTISGAASAGLFELTNGDANGDNVISFEDFSVLQNNFGQSGQTSAQGDFNGDGDVTFADFSILQNGYGQSGSPGPDGMNAPHEAEGQAGKGFERSFADSCFPVAMILLVGGVLVFWRGHLRQEA